MAATGTNAFCIIPPHAVAMETSWGLKLVKLLPPLPSWHYIPLGPEPHNLRITGEQVKLVCKWNEFRRLVMLDLPGSPLQTWRTQRWGAGGRGKRAVVAAGWGLSDQRRWAVSAGTAAAGRPQGWGSGGSWRSGCRKTWSRRFRMKAWKLHTEPNAPESKLSLWKTFRNSSALLTNTTPTPKGKEPWTVTDC